MAGVQRFEDLIAWQKARALTKAVYDVTESHRFRRQYRLTSQLQSAAVSVMSNIAEGFERDGLAEFHRFLTIAKASCGEVRSLLYVALDAGFLETEAFDRLREQVDEVMRIVVGLRASVERNLKASNRRTIAEDLPIPYHVEPE